MRRGEASLPPPPSLRQNRFVLTLGRWLSPHSTSPLSCLLYKFSPCLLHPSVLLWEFYLPCSQGRQGDSSTVAGRHGHFSPVNIKKHLHTHTHLPVQAHDIYQREGRTRRKKRERRKKEEEGRRKAEEKRRLRGTLQGTDSLLHCCTARDDSSFSLH